MLSSVSEFNFEVKTRTATKCLSLPLSCVALGSDTQGTHKEQNLLFVRHARGRKLESGVQKNRSIKPKIRWKEKGLPDVWQGQHQVLEVQQALISLTQEIIDCILQYQPPQTLCLWGFFDKIIVVYFIYRKRTYMTEEIKEEEKCRKYHYFMELG